MAYTPQYTNVANVRLVTDLDANTISDDDGANLIKLGENQVDALIKADNIDTSGWGGTIPDNVVDCATFYSAAEWIRKIATKYAAVEGGSVSYIVKSFENRAKTAWENYLKEFDTIAGQRVLLSLIPITKDFDEKEWRELE